MAKAKKVEETPKSDVGLNEALSPSAKKVSVFEIAERVSNTVLLRDYDYRIKEKMQSIITNYAEIGFMLHEISSKKLYELNGNKSIYDYAKERYDLAPTTVKNAIAVTQRFFVKDNEYRAITVKKEAEGFGFSQLVELLTVEDEKLKDYLPSMPVKKIRELKALNNSDDAVKELISTNSELVDFTKFVLDYDYQGKNELEVKIDASSNLGKRTSEISTYSWSKDGNNLMNVIFKISVVKPKKSDVSFTIELNHKGLLISTNSRNISHVDTYAKSMEDLIHWFDQFMVKVKDHVNSLIPKVDETTGQVILPEDRKYQKLDGAYSYLDDREEKYIDTSDIIRLSVRNHFKNAYYESDGYNLQIFTSEERSRKNKPKFTIQSITDPSRTVLVIHDAEGNEIEKHPLLTDYKEYVKQKAEELLKSIEVSS